MINFYIGNIFCSRCIFMNIYPIFAAQKPFESAEFQLSNGFWTDFLAFFWRKIWQKHFDEIFFVSYFLMEKKIVPQNFKILKIEASKCFCHIFLQKNARKFVQKQLESWNSALSNGFWTDKNGSIFIKIQRQQNCYRSKIGKNLIGIFEISKMRH